MSTIIAKQIREMEFISLVEAIEKSPKTSVEKLVLLANLAGRVSFV
jgi:hypothetical protein